MIRIITALVIGAGWLLLLHSGSLPLFWFVFVCIAAVSLIEYCGMLLAETTGRNKDKIAGVAFGILPVLASYWGRIDAVTAGLATSFLLLAAYSLCTTRDDQDRFQFLARFNFGLMFIGFALAHLVLIMAKPAGNSWLLLLTAITIASDSCAYYTGKHLGRTKLCPAISPNKTVEGLAGGISGGILAAILMCLALFPEMNPFKTAFTAAVLVLFGVIGDLTESVVKRATKVKDSGTILPGHGGLLDRGDSLLMAAPLFYYLIHFGFLGGS